MTVFLACKHPGRMIRECPMAHARLHARTDTHARTHRRKHTRTSSLGARPPSLGAHSFSGGTSSFLWTPSEIVRHREVEVRLKNLSTLNSSGLKASAVCASSEHQARRPEVDSGDVEEAADRAVRQVLGDHGCVAGGITCSSTKRNQIQPSGTANEDDLRLTSLCDLSV
jgi:hypothetical protein